MMGFGTGSLYKCHAIIGHQQAARFYAETKKPNSKYWRAPFEKPLYKTATPHYRMRHIPAEDAYELVLYSTPLVRYLAPTETGEYTVMLRGYGTCASWEWLRLHGWATWYRPVKTVGGQEVLVPLNTVASATYGGVPAGWSAMLTFDKEDKLILSKSWHRPVYVKRSTKEDKEKRADLLHRLDTLVELMVMRLPALHADGHVSRELGKPFAETGRRTAGIWKIADTLHKMLRVGGFSAGELPEGIVEPLTIFMQALYDTSLSKRLVLANEHLSWSGGPASDYPPIAEKDFRSTLRTALVKLAGLNRQSGKKALPLFPESLPRKYCS